MNVLLLSPYHSGSHRQWADGYREHSEHEIEIVSLPGRFWKWRLSGAAPALAEAIARHTATRGAPDTVLATSMTDLAGVLGLARASLAGVPVALYMHENQVTYPMVGRARRDPRLGLISWHSVLAADGVAFNSESHLAAFIEALPAFLAAFPDEPGRAVVDVAGRTSVLPVGVDLRRIDGPSEQADPPLILWNHRWDPDKAPEEFFEALSELMERGPRFRLALAGERFGGQAEAHAGAIERFGDRVIVSEHLPDHDYCSLLRRSDIVVSTARQEFFGVAIVEAMYAGALPLLPDRLVYPERIPSQHRHRCLYSDRRGLVDLLDQAITDIEEARTVGGDLSKTVAQFDWSEVAPRYDAWLSSLA